jgi:uncharacterized membrane protein
MNKGLAGFCFMLLVGVAAIIAGYISVTQLAYSGLNFSPANYYLGMAGIVVGVLCILAACFAFFSKGK